MVVYLSFNLALFLSAVLSTETIVEKQSILNNNHNNNNNHKINYYYDKRSNQLINEVVMIHTHDAMTGEMNEERDYIVSKWTKTQNNTIIEQLNCGARAFDYRPYLNDNGDIYAHHGPIVIHKTLKSTLVEIIEWGHKNPTELVVITFSHCVTQRVNNNYYSGINFKQ